MVQIKKVMPKHNNRLEVVFENGHSVVLDFTSRLNTVRFGLLSKPDFFLLAETNGNVITWGNRIEISSSEVFQLAKNNK